MISFTLGMSEIRYNSNFSTFAVVYYIIVKNARGARGSNLELSNSRARLINVFFVCPSHKVLVPWSVCLRRGKGRRCCFTTGLPVLLRIRDILTSPPTMTTYTTGIYKEGRDNVERNIIVIKIKLPRDDDDENRQWQQLNIKYHCKPFNT